MKKISLIFLLLFAISCTSVKEDHLVILHTNDTHSQIDPADDGLGGILRRKVLIDSIRGAEDNVLLIDAGDAVQSTLYFTLFGGEIEFPLMDSLKYDIQILGNHEFDNGIDSLATIYKNVKAEKLSSNYDFTGTPMEGYFKPYTIKEYNGKKIAFIGVNLIPTGIISQNNIGSMKFKEPLNVADSLAGVLKNDLGADRVIAITHIGYPQEKEGVTTDTVMIKRSHNIDLVIGGHSHTVINPADSASVPYMIKNADGREILVCQVGKSGKYLGRLDINLDTWEVKETVLPVDSRYDNRIDKNLEKYIAPYKAAVDSLMQVPIAKSVKAMGTKNIDAAMNWVSDLAMEIYPEFYKGKVDFAIMNKGGIRTDMPVGGVSEGLIRAMFPFTNYFVVIEIKGSDLLDAFAVMAERKGDAVSKGVDIKYTDDAEILRATLNGCPIQKDKTYTVLTLDYLANGNDYMVPLKSGKWLFEDTSKLCDRILARVKEMGKKGIAIDATDEVRMHK